MLGGYRKRCAFVALVLCLSTGVGAGVPGQPQQGMPAADSTDQPIKTSVQNPDAVAVVVGISKYQNRDVPPVQYALQDADAVSRVLTETLGYASSRVFVRKDDQAIGTQLKLLLQQRVASLVEPGVSDVFLYYSGHGAPNRSEGYLIPWDYDPSYEPTSVSAYALKDLYADLAKLRARSVTVVLESCFSGSSEGGTLIKAASPLFVEMNSPIQALAGSNSVVISASGAREIASWHPDRPHGLMTYYWLRGMRGEAGDEQGRVTPERMRQYLRETVPVVARQSKGRTQTPEVTALQPNRVLAQLPVSALRTGAARLDQTYGALRVIVDRGGDLVIDGVNQGTLPPGVAFTQDRVATGPHQIEIRRESYETIREEIMIAADRQTSKSYNLALLMPNQPQVQQAYGLIAVTVDRGGTLTIDGKKEADLSPYATYTTARIAAGPHRVRVELNGFVTEDRELMVPPNQTAPLNLTLRAAASAAPPAAPPANIAANANPAAAANRAPGVPIEFVRIAPGEFQMGCSAGDTGCDPAQSPAHQVRISRAFEIGKYEVTQAQWQAAMGTNPSNFKGDALPVENVSWSEAQEMIGRLNARNDGYRYRLPTEAEWEYAARAGVPGSGIGNLDQVAWYSSNSGRQTHPVGQKQPNAWGLYDMQGNVLEWVQDWFGGYGSGPLSDPRGPATGQYRVVRGGSWSYNSWDLRVSFRGIHGPGGRDLNVGFRLLREVIP